jgi:pimeloyl-ACP methyl ester carboxylesterase
VPENAESKSGRTRGGLAWDVAGAGEPLVLVHAGVADRRMWDPQWAGFARRHRVLRYDARGFGDTAPPSGPWAHHRDLAELLDELEIGCAHLVAGSMGAGIAVELVLERPSAVASLVLAAPGGAVLAGATDELRALWRAEGEALDRGDLDAAVEVNLRAWVDGPRRPLSAVDPAVRAAVGAMQRRAFEVATWDDAASPEEGLEPEAPGRLGELTVPVLILVGDEDQSTIRDEAARIAAAIPGARLEAWRGVGHLPSLERPAAFEDLVLGFVASHPIEPASPAQQS